MLRVNHLTGFGAGNSATTSYLSGEATSNSHTITIPSTSAEDDLALLFDFGWNSSTSAVTDVVPTGWTGVLTAADTSGGKQARVRISYKILAGGDPGSSVTGINDTNDAKVMLVFAGPISSVTPQDLASFCDSSNPSAQTANASGGSPALIVFGCHGYSYSTGAAFSTASPAFDETVIEPVTSDLIAGYKYYASGPQDHTIDGPGGSNRAVCLASGYLEVS